MTVLLAEMTREEIHRRALHGVAILPTASTEQHGPHLPVGTDALICEAVVRGAAERADRGGTLAVAPTLCYGNSLHHVPFPGVLSLNSHTYIAALTEVLESLVASGFAKLLVVNGHGGNTAANQVVALDMVHRLGHPITIAVADYWDVAKPALAQQGLLPKGRFPGHAGLFETSVVLAIRPELVDRETMGGLADAAVENVGLNGDLPGAMVQTHGVWAAGPGYTDYPAAATAEAGRAYLEVMTEAMARFIARFAAESE